MFSSDMKLLVLFGVLLAVYCETIESEAEVVARTDSIPFSESFTETKHPFPDSGDVTCVCDGETVVQKIKVLNLEKFFDIISADNYCKPNVASSICKFIRHCSVCKAEIRWCRRPIPDRGNYICYTRSRNIPDTDTDNFIFSSAAEIAQRRSRRQAGFDMHACGYPTRFTKSDMTCVKYSRYVKCVQDCIFGHTLGESARKIRRCHYNENKWLPEGEFKDCEPYMHCSLEMLSSGTFQCATSTVHIPAYCNVSCAAYGKRPSTPLKAYFCTEDGWSEKLPHCVLPKKEQIELVPRPVKPRQNDRDVPPPQIVHSFTESTDLDFKHSSHNKSSKFESVNFPASELKKSNPSRNAQARHNDLRKSKMLSDTPNDPRKHRSADFSEDIQDKVIDDLKAN